MLVSTRMEGILEVRDEENINEEFNQGIEAGELLGKRRSRESIGAKTKRGRTESYILPFRQ